jgi:hypothetical protein
VIFENLNFILPTNIFQTKIGEIIYTKEIDALLKEQVIALEPFHPEWKIYLTSAPEFSTLPLFEHTHKKIYDYANQWNIDSETIKEYVQNNY